MSATKDQQQQNPIEVEAEINSDTEESLSNMVQTILTEPQLSTSDAILASSQQLALSTQRTRPPSQRIKRQIKIPNYKPATSTNKKSKKATKPERATVKVLALRCPVDACTNVFKLQAYFDKHMKSKHGISKYRCLVIGCGASFDNKLVWLG